MQKSFTAQIQAQACALRSKKFTTSHHVRIMLKIFLKLMGANRHNTVAGNPDVESTARSTAKKARSTARSTAKSTEKAERAERAEDVEDIN